VFWGGGPPRALSPGVFFFFFFFSCVLFFFFFGGAAVGLLGGLVAGGWFAGEGVFFLPISLFIPFLFLKLDIEHPRQSAPYLPAEGNVWAPTRLLRNLSPFFPSGSSSESSF